MKKPPLLPRSLLWQQIAVGVAAAILSGVGEGVKGGKRVVNKEGGGRRTMKGWEVTTFFYFFLSCSELCNGEGEKRSSSKGRTPNNASSQP